MTGSGGHKGSTFLGKTYNFSISHIDYAIKSFRGFPFASEAGVNPP
jgi:hypothetical protein